MQRCCFRAAVTGVIRFFARHVRVVMVDEYRTSKACSNCQQKFMKYDDKRVGTCEGGCRPLDRDLNGAINIKKVFESLARTGDRPGILARDRDEDMEAAN